MASMEAGVSFTLDDGTGKIALVRWNGMYLKVQVTLVGFQAKQQGFARSIRPVTNFNEVVLHFIECIHVHLENVRPKFSAYPGTGGQQRDLQRMVMEVMQQPDI
uniref:OB domain-containing protein n=1 Tax=Setaria italica TaxID=4555 RepID=K3Y2R6_SETIT